ncbi:Arm DNA-binding domain-containing protein [Facilibium subflavum]|uniref:Arm DNA-binding domain-containing protein n=1 Tax=Facilibium subflavum TaxID=2219058 RepID=UPI0013C2EB20
MRLNDTKIKGLKHTGKEKLCSDGRGSMLYLRVREVSKSFLFKYKMSGKTCKLSLGTYPDLSLKNAREKMSQKVQTGRYLAMEVCGSKVAVSESIFCLNHLMV